MYPAPSIIFFTTASGLGYGLAALLGLGILDAGAFATKIAWIVALVLISVGLLSSTAHLGHPERAWRALSQWRSSWLSREGVAALLTFVPLLLAAAEAILFARTFLAAGLIGAVMCAVTVHCTGMLYASLKSVDAWHTPLTPACYLLFAAAGGALLGSFFASCGGGNLRPLCLLSLLALAAAWGAKLAWRNRMVSLDPRSTAQSATQLGHLGAVRLFEAPHLIGNYLTDEMGYRVARKHAVKLARLSFLVGGGIPALLMLVPLAVGDGPVAISSATLAVLAYATGVTVERWLFFAEARHAVMSYYGG